MREKFESDLICPIEKSKFIKINKNYFISKKHKYPIISGIPCLYVDGKLNSNNKKTQFVKKFYMINPFPNYNEFDNVKIFCENPLCFKRIFLLYLYLWQALINCSPAGVMNNC